MKPVVFWMALLFLFSGIMVVLFASGYLDRRNDSSNDELAHSEQIVDAPAGELLKDFLLTDQTGEAFDSQSLEGKIWVGSVFFSSCPSTCRMQNLRVAELQKLYGDEGVEFVSITCDPERDTVDTLREYARVFNANPERWHFLTGNFDLIRRIGAEKFGIAVEKETHSDRLILFDREGSKVGSYRSTVVEDFDELKETLTSVLSRPIVESMDSDPVQPEDQSDHGSSESDNEVEVESPGSEASQDLGMNCTRPETCRV